MRAEAMFWWITWFAFDKKGDAMVPKSDNKNIEKIDIKKQVTKTKRMTIYSRALEKACNIWPLQGGLHSDNMGPSCLCKKIEDKRLCRGLIACQKTLVAVSWGQHQAGEREWVDWKKWGRTVFITLQQEVLTDTNWNRIAGVRLWTLCPNFL